MPRFEMLGGRCDLGDGEFAVFREGKRKVVTSDKPLDTMFKNQWRRLDDEKTKMPADHRNTPDFSGGQVMDDSVAVQRAKEVKKNKKAAAGDDEITDLSARKTSRKIAERQEQEQKRGVLREDDKEEDEDLENLEEEENEADAPDEEEADETGSVQAEAEEEEDDEAPAAPAKKTPVTAAKAGMKRKMKRKK